MVLGEYLISIHCSQEAHMTTERTITGIYRGALHHKESYRVFTRSPKCCLAQAINVRVRAERRREGE